MAPKSGYSTSLPDDILLDTAVLYFGTSLYGATKGGLRYQPQREFRNVEFDGKRSPIKGLDRVVSRMPKIVGTVIEIAPADIALLEPGSTQLALITGVTSFRGKAAGSLFVSGDYVSDVKCIWQRGNGDYFRVRFPSAIIEVFDGPQGADKEEATINIEIGARLDMGVSGAQPGDDPALLEYLAEAQFP